MICIVKKTKKINNPPPPRKIRRSFFSRTGRGVYHTRRPFFLAGTHPDAEHVVGQPRPFVYDVLDAHADRGQYPAQLRDATGPVAQRRVELHQPTVDGQSSVQAPAQNRSVDVAAAQQQHDSGTVNGVERALLDAQKFFDP